MLITQRQLELANWLHNPQTVKTDAQFTISEIIENGVGALVPNYSDKRQTSSIHLTLQKADKQLQIIHNLQLIQFLKVFEAFDEANIPFVVLKGWALSYKVYEQPHYRPKTDIDILINQADKNRVTEIFKKYGFTDPRGWEPKAIIDQFTMRKKLAHGLFANVDIHLKISNDKKLQRALVWDEIYEDKTYVKNLQAKIPSIQFLIIHAAVHILHHYIQGDMIKLIWIHDIYLLIKKAEKEEIDALLLKLKNTDLAKPATRVFRTVDKAFPDPKLRKLIYLTEDIDCDSKFNYLLSSPSLARSYLRNLKQNEGLKAKLEMLSETLFPPKEEIYRKYGPVAKWTLPYYYAIRIIKGVSRHLF